MDKSIGQKLFVLGHARSGTTIMRQLLNSSEDVFLLGEAHIFESHWNPRFVADFNARHERTSKIKSKGVRLPTQFEGMLPEDILKHFARHYEWVGEKIAVGPMSGLGTRAASGAVDYHQAYHLDASYVLTFRAPAPSLHSLRRIFPNISTSLLIQGWMLSFVEIVAASHIFKRVILAPLEFQSFEYWSRIQSRLGISGRADTNWINPEKGKAASTDTFLDLARLLANECEWDVNQADEFLCKLTYIYERFLGWINKETLYFHRSVPFVGEITRSLVEVHHLLDQMCSTHSASSTLPISVCGWLGNGIVHRDKLVLPLPGERLRRFSTALRESLFSGHSSIVLTDKSSPYPLTREGIDLICKDAWLLLKPLPDLNQHRSLMIALPIEPLAIATFRIRLRPGEGHSRFVMLQMGSTGGFSNTFIDCRMQEIVSISTAGTVKSVLSQVETLAGNDLRISISAIFADGQNGYLRVYLCDETGSIDFQKSETALMISDLVLSYSHHDCGL